MANPKDRHRAERQASAEDATRPAESDAGPNPLEGEAEELPVERAPAPAEAAPSEGTPLTSAEVEAQLAEARNRWLRAEADMQNVRRRAAREREEQRREIEDQWLVDVAGLQDDLERALATARAAEAPESWTKGVELVRSRMSELLGRYGVTPIDPAGQPFDPNLHEAMLEVDAPEGAAPGTVVQVVVRGLARNGRAIRAARVVVARAPGSGA